MFKFACMTLQIYWVIWKIDTYVCNIWVCMYDFASKYINTALLKSFMFDKVWKVPFVTDERTRVEKKIGQMRVIPTPWKVAWSDIWCLHLALPGIWTDHITLFTCPGTNDHYICLYLESCLNLTVPWLAHLCK